MQVPDLSSFVYSLSTPPDESNLEHTGHDDSSIKRHNL